MSVLPRANLSLSHIPSTTHDFILRDLSVKDLLSYSLVNRAAHSTVQDFYLRAFRIENVLCRYFQPQQIRGFRRMQRSTACLISGSTALSFFTREVYDGSDLDLYVESKFCREVARYIQSVGYVFQACRTELKHQAGLIDEAIKEMLVKVEESGDEGNFNDRTFEGYPMSGIADVFSFVRGERKIQIIASFSSPLDVILSFHSTAVMNVITHVKAISFYPRATFIDKISLRSWSGGSIDHNTALEKYTQRGWKIVESVDAGSGLDEKSAFSAILRNPGDRQCWTVYYDLGPESNPLRGLFSYQNWQTWRLNFNNGRDARMEYNTLAWDNLERGYCVARDLFKVLEVLQRHPGLFDINSDEEGYIDYKLQKSLLALINRERQGLAMTSRRRDLHSLLLSAFKDARTKYPNLATEFLPTAFAAQFLMEHLELVYQTYRTPPKITFNFAQNQLGYVWTNVKIELPSLRGARSDRVVNPIKPVVDPSAVSYLRAFRVNLEVVVDVPPWIQL
ncbi:hypothetical protein L218DRAFT_1081483, partial [Marasmius fiardii PR-910]